MILFSVSMASMELGEQEYEGGGWDDEEFDVPDLGPPVDDGEKSDAAEAVAADAHVAAADDDWLATVKETPAADPLPCTPLPPPPTPPLIAPLTLPPTPPPPPPPAAAAASAAKPVDDRPMIIVDMTLLAAKEGLPELHNRFGAYN